MEKLELIHDLKERILARSLVSDEDTALEIARRWVNS